MDVVVNREIQFDASELKKTLWEYCATVFEGYDGKKLRGLCKHLKAKQAGSAVAPASAATAPASSSAAKSTQQAAGAPAGKTKPAHSSTNGR